MLLMELFHAKLNIIIFKKLAINIIFELVFRNALVQIRIRASVLLNYGSGFHTLRFSRHSFAKFLANYLFTSYRRNINTSVFNTDVNVPTVRNKKKIKKEIFIFFLILRITRVESGSGSGRPKNQRTPVLRFRMRNTVGHCSCHPPHPPPSPKS